MKKDMMPELTIIIATLNAGGVIERCLHSIARQTYSDFELIVFDGLSTDNTLEIIKSHGELCDYVESSKDSGIYNAWNKALKKASGKWLMFIGADDFFASDDILSRLMLHATQTDADLVTVRNAEIDESGRVVKTYGEPWCWQRFRKYMNICHVGLLHNRRLFEKCGEFDESYKIAGDYEFLMRSARMLTASDFAHVVVNCGNRGVSRTQIFRAFREAVRIHKSYKSAFWPISILRYARGYLMVYFRHLFKTFSVG